MILPRAFLVWSMTVCAGDALGGVSMDYGSIANRNPFGLRPPLPPRTEQHLKPEPPPAPLAIVEVTGLISGVLPSSTKSALLEIIPAPGKPLGRHLLKEGQKVESVELLAIDVGKGQVTLRIGTVLTNVSLKRASTGKAIADPPGLLGSRHSPPPPAPPSISPVRPLRGARSGLMNENAPALAPGVSPPAVSPEQAYLQSQVQAEWARQRSIRLPPPPFRV